MEMEEMDLLEYWQILVKRKWMIIALFVVAVVIALIFSVTMEPVYEANTTLMLKSQQSSALAALDPLGTIMGGSSANTMIQNYVYILKSRTILQETARVVGLGDITNEELGSLSRSLTVQPIQGTEVIKITMESTDPEFATEFINTLSQVFIDSTRDSNRSDLRTARLFLAEQIQIVSTELAEAEEALKDFRETERVLQPGTESSLLLQQSSKWDTALAETTIARIEAEQRLQQIGAQILEQDEVIISSTSIQANPLVQTYQQRLANLEISLSGAKEKYTNHHPEVLSLQAEIEQTKSNLANEVERVIGVETQTINPIRNDLYAKLISNQVELFALEAREKAVTVLREEIDEQYAHLPQKELELVRLMRDVEVAEEIYLLLTTQNEEIRINEQMHSGNLEVVDEAIVPSNPVKPRVKLNLAIGGVLGLFIGMGLAFLLEFVDNTVKTKEEVEALLEIPVIGQIPKFNFMEDKEQRRQSSTKVRM